MSELPEEAREAALVRECAGDAELLARLKVMLSGAEDDGFLAQSTRGDMVRASEQMLGQDQPGRRIGPYRLVKLIGEGGFGSVFLAEQELPVTRKVALKVLKLGMDTRQVIARFEQERQALALMDHPGIARVLEAGTTEEGRPYFVMELVEGEPIVEHCDTRHLGIRPRLELFSQVCAAVQHAHIKGVIHRDLKPRNILIANGDGHARAKVIDFGIAKAVGGQLTAAPPQTEASQFMGTPEYMSPEQACGGEDIDTRTDVYSLGVVLYELLTGTTPFGAGRIRGATQAEIQRLICEVDPPRPSTRVSAGSGVPEKVAKDRGADAKSLHPMIKGELDWIVMKAMEKDPRRRYATASGLADDVARYLSGEAVHAAPPGRSYLVRKFVSRHRAMVALATLVGVALVLGLAGTSSGLMWAMREKARADEAVTQAQRELDRALEIKRLITQMLQSVDPRRARMADATLLKGILDEAAGRLDAGEVKDELVAAELHGTIAGVYESLAMYADAEKHLTAALELTSRVHGPEHPDGLRLMIAEAGLYRRQGRYAEAEALCLRAREIQGRVLGPMHRETLISATALASIYIGQGRYKEAEAMDLRTLADQRRTLGNNAPETLETELNLSSVYINQGRFEEAEPLLAQALDARRRSLGEDHPGSLEVASTLAGNLFALRRYEESEALHDRTLALQRKVLGDGHPETLRTLGNLAALYSERNRLDDAERALKEVAAIQERVLGAEHLDTLITKTNLGALYLNQQRYEDAAAALEVTVPVLRRVHGAHHPWTEYALDVAGRAYDRSGRHDDAAKVFREVIEIVGARADAEGAPPSASDEMAELLLHHRVEALQDPRRALGYAAKACAEASAERLERLAEAMDRTGDTAGAIEMQRRAIGMLPEGHPSREQAERQLREYARPGVRPDELQKPN
ncbi:MAG: tetratricopeptide repeat protein [Phycisphaerales bacterium]